MRCALLLIGGLGLAVTAAAATMPAAKLRCTPTRGDAVDPPDYGSTQCFPSPDGTKLAIVRSGHIAVDYRGRTTPVGAMGYGRLIWNSTSTGIAIDDNDDSGEAGYFAYVDASGPRARWSTQLRRTAERAGLKAFGCHGRAAYMMTYFVGWDRGRSVRVAVQNGIHSEGCKDRDDVEIGVVGNPISGKLYRVLSQNELERRWCGANARRNTGICATDR